MTIEEYDRLTPADQLAWRRDNMKEYFALQRTRQFSPIPTKKPTQDQVQAAAQRLAKGFFK